MAAVTAGITITDVTTVTAMTAVTTVAAVTDEPAVTKVGFPPSLYTVPMFSMQAGWV